MATVHITAYPFAVLDGDLEIPDDVVNRNEDELRDYIADHWNDIQFGGTDLDFAGCEYDVD